MDTLIISNENNILHIFNDGNEADYSFYDCKGHLIDGGVLVIETENATDDVILKEILNRHKKSLLFSTPYHILKGDKAENLLELIEFEESRNIQSKVPMYVSSLKEDSNKSNDEIEREK